MDPIAGGGGKQVGDPPPLTCRLISSSPPSCILPCQKKSTPLAAVRRLPPECGGSRQGRRWIRRRHATWWWVRPRHAACWRVRPHVPSAQRHWPCTRMANVRSQAKGRGLMSGGSEHTATRIIGRPVGSCNSNTLMHAVGRWAAGKINQPKLARCSTEC
ncbi:unnamed protein product [Urochloa humidicola]